MPSPPKKKRPIASSLDCYIRYTLPSAGDIVVTTVIMDNARGQS